MLRKPQTNEFLANLIQKEGTREVFEVMELFYNWIVGMAAQLLQLPKVYKLHT